MSSESTEFVLTLQATLERTPGVTMRTLDRSTGVHIPDIVATVAQDSRLDEAVRRAGGKQDKRLAGSPLGVVFWGGTAAVALHQLRTVGTSSFERPRIQANLLLPTRAIELGSLTLPGLVNGSWINRKLTDQEAEADLLTAAPAVIVERRREIPEPGVTLHCLYGLPTIESAVSVAVFEQPT